MQLLLISLGILVIVYDLWRWLGPSPVAAGVQGDGAEGDPEHALFNIIILIFGLVLIVLGAIMSLG